MSVLILNHNVSIEVARSSSGENILFKKGDVMQGFIQDFFLGGRRGGESLGRRRGPAR